MHASLLGSGATSCSSAQWPHCSAACSGADVSRASENSPSPKPLQRLFYVQAMQCLQQHHQLQQPLQELQQHQERQQLPPEPAQLPSPQQAQHQQRHEQDQHVTQGQQHKQKRKQQQKQQHHQHHQHHQQQQQARETRGEDADQQEQQQLLQARALHEKKALEAAVLLLKERAGPDTGQRYKKLMKLLKKKSPPSHGIEGASPFAWGVVVMDELQCLIRNYSRWVSSARWRHTAKRWHTCTCLKNRKLCTISLDDDRGVPHQDDV